MNSPNLFNYATKYPKVPGAQRPQTSQDAAKAIKERAPTLRDQVLELLKKHELTPDECAKALGKSVLSIRPRLTELKLLGHIVDTGETRKNESGIKAQVWRASAYAGDL